MRDVTHQKGHNYLKYMYIVSFVDSFFKFLQAFKKRVCNTADLGDEFHYLLKCDYFNEKRKSCIDKKIFKKL